MTSSSHFNLPPLEPNEDHYISFLSSPSQASFSSSSSVIRPTAFYPSQDQEGSYHRELFKHYQHSEEVDEYVSQGGSSDQQSSPHSQSTLGSGSEYGLKLSIFGEDPHHDDSPRDNNGPVSWMSSKMRFMKKMISSDSSIDAEKPTTDKLWFQDQKQSSSTNANNPVDSLASNSTLIRTCSDCNTTRTPLWRSGPKGPKSLCNACGIRQRKARRAIAATAAASNGVLATNTSSMQTKVHCNKKKSGKGHVAQHKKQCKLGATPRRRNLGFEDFIVNLSNSLALHQVIQQDDQTEAAILLMALSCGLVSG